MFLSCWFSWQIMVYSVEAFVIPVLISWNRFLQRHLNGLCQTHPAPVNKNTGNSAWVLLKITLTSYYCTSNIIEPSTVFLTFDMGQLQKKKKLPNLKEIHLKRTKIFLINPLSPNIHKQILQTYLHTFPYRISWGKLIKDQRFFSWWSFD